MRRRRRIAWRVLLAVAALGLLVGIVFRVGAGWPMTRALLNATLLEPFDCELAGGRVRWSLVPRVRIDARDVSLLGAGFTASVGRFHAQLSGVELLAGKLALSELHAEKVRIDLAAGQGGAETPQLPDPAALALPLTRLRCESIALEDLLLTREGSSADFELAVLSGSLDRRPEGPTLAIDTLAALVELPQPLILRAAGAELVAWPERFQARKLCAEIGTGRLEGDAGLWPGAQGPAWELELDFDRFSLQAIRGLVDATLTRAESRLSGHLQARGEADTIHFAGRVQGFVDPIEIDAEAVAGWWDGTELVLAQGRGLVEEIGIDVASAAIDPRTQDYRLQGIVSDFDLEPHLDFMAGTVLSGPVELEGSHFGGEELWIDARAARLQGSVFGLALEGGALDLRYADQHFAFDSLRVGWPGAAVAARGTVDLDSERMRWDGHLALRPESPFFASFVPVEGLRCALRADGRLGGPLETPRLTATYAGGHLEYGALLLDELRGEVDLDSVFHRPTGRAALRGAGALGVLPITIDESALVVRGRELFLTELLAHQERRRIRASGPLRIDQGLSGDLGELALDSPFGGAVAGDTVHFASDSIAFHLAPTTIHLAGGDLSLEGRWSGEEGLDMGFACERIDLERLVRLGGGAARSAAGRLSGQGRIKGTFEDPGVSGEWRVEGLQVGPAHLGELRAGAALRHGRIHVDHLRAQHRGSTLRAFGDYPLGPQLGWHPLPGAPDSVFLNLELEEWSLAELGALVALDSLGGQVDAHARLSGTLAAPQLALSADAFALTVLGDDYGELSLETEFQAGRLHLRARDQAGSQARGTVPFDFTLAPPAFAPGDDSLSVELSLREIDAAFLRHLVPDIDSAGGPLSFEGRLGGQLPWPDAYGELRARQGRVRLIWMDVPLHAISGRVRVDGTRARVERATGRMGAEGRFEAAGLVRLDDFVPVDYDLEVSGKALPIGWIPDLRAVVDADLRFADNVHISGDVQVHEAVYSRAFGEEPEPIPPPALPGEELPFALSYDLMLEGDRNIWLRNTEAEMELRGKAHLQSLAEYDELPFTIQGELEVIRGTYTLLGKNSFEIERGTIRMLDPSVLDPEMEVEARATLRERVRDEQGRYQSRSVPIHLSLTGEFFSDLTYQFTDLSQGHAPIPIEDMVLLLTFGRRRAAIDQGGLYDQSTAAADASAITAQLLETRVSELLDISLDISTGSSSPLESLDETYVGLGKYLNPKLFVYYSQYLSADPRRRLGVEYAFTDQVLVAGELDETDPNASRYNVDLRYRLEY